MTLDEALRIQRKIVVLEYAAGIANAAKACREFAVPHSSFYRWKKAYRARGADGLQRQRPVGMTRS